MTRQGIRPGVQPDDVRLAIRANNLLEIASIEQVADVLGYEDMELLLAQIEAIHEHHKKASQ